MIPSQGMKPVHKLHFSETTFLIPLLFILMMWGAYWAEIRFGFNFKPYGIHPREGSGLPGIITSPFIHANISHLASNTLPLFFLSMALFYFYERIAWKVLLFGALLTGILTWIMAEAGTNHIGASGIVYLLVAFLFFKGIWSRNYRLIAFSLVVVFIYGSLIWGVFPQEKNVSWEGHLSGLISGVTMALFYRKYQVEFHEHQHTERPVSAREAEFLQHFDEDGNFMTTEELTERKRKQAENPDSKTYN